LIFPAYNVIVAILLTQNYHPNACNPWLPYNNARKLFCLFLALLYYFYSEKASRTYLFYKSSRRQLVFLLFFSPFSYIIIIATTIDVINTADTAAITHSQKNPTCIFLIS